jgi:hypothetical protein
VFDDLLDADGSEIDMKPASVYTDGTVDVSWDSIVAVAMARMEMAMGYETTRDGVNNVVVNPLRTPPPELAPTDRVIVLAENED